MSSNEMFRKSVHSLSHEGKLTCNESPRNSNFVNQQNCQFILAELSRMLQVVAEKRDELLKKIEEESNERSDADGKTELG